MVAKPHSRSDHSAESGDQVPAEEVRAQLTRILECPAFKATPKRRQMLQFVVEETLAGRRRQIKGYTIGANVFGRGENFDPNSDPVVRLEARRLRHDLDNYYVSEGRTDPLRISIPKGQYVPIVERQEFPLSAADSAGIPAEKTHFVSKGLSISRLSWFALAGFAAILLVAVFLNRINVSGGLGTAVPNSGSEVALEMPRGPLIAVLPFLNLSGDSDREHLSIGVSEQLATELTKFHGIRVLPLGSVKSHNDGLVDPREIQREYGADYTLEGSVRATDKSIRITIRLVDAASGNYGWTKNFLSPMSPANIYDIQEAVAQEVAANLAGSYGHLATRKMKEATRKAPESLEAYDCVLRYYHYQNSVDLRRFELVRDCLERAVLVEPDYAEAWAVLANVYMQEKRFGYAEASNPMDSARKAMAAARQALSLDPNSATGHMILSTLLFTEGDIAGFREASERALSTNPNDSDTLAHYGMRLAFLGEWERGLLLLDRAMELNPSFPDWYLFPRAIHSYQRGQYEDALVALENIEMPQFFWTPMLKAASLGQLGKLDEASAAADELMVLNPNFEREGVGYIKLWQMQEPLVLAIIDGLEKAGLNLRLEVTASKAN